MFKDNINKFEYKLENRNFFNILLSWLKSNKQNYEVELIEVKQNSATTLYTKNNKEVIFVISGKGGVVVEDQGNMIEFGDSIYVPSNCARTLANIDKDPLQIISITYKTNTIK